MKPPKRRSNPAGTVPVLLMNPGDKRTMAKRRRKGTRRKSSGRRRRNPTTVAMNPRRGGRRRTRRRRNPSIGGIIVDGLLALAGGGAVGAGAYALDGANLGQGAKAGIIAGGGAVIGGVVSLFSKSAGAGIIGAGAAFGLKTALEMLLVSGGTQPQQAAEVPTTAALAGYGYPALGAVEAELAGVDVHMNAVEAELAGVY